jgi:hypothetical protein
MEKGPTMLIVVGGKNVFLLRSRSPVMLFLIFAVRVELMMKTALRLLGKHGGGAQVLALKESGGCQ